MMRSSFERLRQYAPVTRMAIAGTALTLTGMLLSVLLYQAVSARVAFLAMPEEMAPAETVVSAFAPAPVAVIRESFVPALGAAGGILTGFGRVLARSGEVVARRVWFGAREAADYTGESVASAVAPLFGYLR